MKIGILTLPLHTNYGGILQAYALQTILERMGHEVVLIDKRWKPIPWDRSAKVLFHIKNTLRVLTGKKKSISYKHPSIYPLVSQNTQPFIDKYIHTYSIKKWSDIHADSFDAIVVGGDQIWRPKYMKSLMDSRPQDIYLGFTKGWNIKRLSYAPSFGTAVWEYNDIETDECKQLLHEFNGISVRETIGVDLCQKHFNVVAEHVLDPTMLLSKDDYIALCQDYPKSKGNLLTYILDRNKNIEELIDSIAQKKSLIPFCVNSRVEDSKAPVQERIQPPVEQWLRGFYDAEFIITDSFHACVFALLFNKPFIVIGNAKRGMARFESLLGMFEQQYRLSEGTNIQLTAEIFQTPNADFNKVQTKSMQFLIKNLQ